MPTPNDIRLEDVPPEIRKQIWKQELEAYKARKHAERQERRDQRGSRRQPTRGRYKAVREGRYKRWRRPIAKPEDRRWVPGALAHWRRVHGLSPQGGAGAHRLQPQLTHLVGLGGRAHRADL